MAEHTGAELSSPALASDQSREGIREEPSREIAAQTAKEQLTVEQKGRAREAARRARPGPRGASIAGPPSEIAGRAEEQRGGLTPIPTSAEIASAGQSAAKKEIAAEIISGAPLHSPDAIAEAPSAVRQTTDDETLHDAVGSPEALPEESEEMEQTVTNDSGSCVPVAGAVAQTSPECPAPWEIERKLQLEKALQPTTEHAFAKWRDALWEALHGRWTEAGWEFARGAFHLLTQAATWRRVGKAVLNFLARFIPGREPYVLRRSREIKELFRELHEEPKKPGTWSNCPK